MTAGIRPINNIVDITNYVMEEYGQPMHAYDLETIEDRKIVVARAKDGEKFVTLDGQERNLESISGYDKIVVKYNNWITKDNGEFELAVH